MKNHVLLGGETFVRDVVLHRNLSQEIKRLANGEDALYDAKIYVERALKHCRDYYALQFIAERMTEYNGKDFWLFTS